MNSKVLANEALRILKNYKEEYPIDAWVSTQYIGDNFKDTLGNKDPLKDSSYQSLRKTLERLYHAGAIDRRLVGQAKKLHRWKLLIDTWDRMDPFKRQGSVPVQQTTPSEIAPAVTEAWRKKVEGLENQIKTLQRELTIKDNENKALTEELQGKEATVKVLHIKRYDGKEYKLKNRTFPKVFDRVRKLGECRRNIMLVGPAGSGKTFIGKLLSDVLDLDFASISCTAGMSEAHLLGRSVPNLAHGKNRFQGTDFLKVYENGGVGLLDELDAADSNLMLCVNSGLANGYMNIPNRQDNPRAIRHPDFICIGTANTIGRGATRMYSGRNQIDEATLDRFRIGFVECSYDPGIEKVLCPDDGKVFVNGYGDDKYVNQTVSKLVLMGYGIRGTCQYIRHKIEKGSIRRIMSSRFMEDAWIMHTQAGWDLKTILEVFFEGWTDEERAKIA